MFALWIPPSQSKELYRVKFIIIDTYTVKYRRKKKGRTLGTRKHVTDIDSRQEIEGKHFVEPRQYRPSVSMNTELQRGPDRQQNVEQWGAQQHGFGSQLQPSGGIVTAAEDRQTDAGREERRWQSFHMFPSTCYSKTTDFNKYVQNILYYDNPSQCIGLCGF